VRPVNFRESNVVLQPPMGSTDILPLPAHSDGEQCVSRWRCTWLERLQVLWHGHVWVHVLTGSTQPPISVQSYRSAFQIANRKK